MRFVTFSDGPAERVGALREGNGEVVDLASAAASAPDAAALGSLQQIIGGGDDALARCAQLLRNPPAVAIRPLAQCSLLAPLPRPLQMRDFIAFERHLTQCLRTAALMRGESEQVADAARPPPAWYQQPLYYKCNRLAVCGTGTEVRWPAYSSVMDYELEFAAVIGRGGRDIPSAVAHQHIFGYMIFNDLSARDAQLAEMPGMLGPAKSKDFDNANVLGPWLVTADEVGDPYGLSMAVSVNGQLRGEGNSATMHWTFDRIVAHLSQSETLYPGEVLGSGTVGDGCGLESGRFLADGDEVTLRVDGLGELSNRIFAPHTTSVLS
ncbi:MAG: fumarylacetoacetate hydrolase family protein [Pseudomonadota bacterium]